MNDSEKIRNNIYIGIIVVSLLIIVVLSVNYLKDRGNKTDSAAEETSVAKLEEKDDKVLVSVSTETIRERLSDMGFLVTQEYSFTQVEEYTKDIKLLNFIPTSSEIVYSYDGSVTAGVDFEKIEISKDDDKQSIVVKLPESEIQAVIVDKDTFKIYSEKESIWNPIKLEDYNDSLSKYENEAKKKAIDSGILEKSDEQAKALITNFIKSLPSVSGYDIEFE